MISVFVVRPRGLVSLDRSVGSLPAIPEKSGRISVTSSLTEV